MKTVKEALATIAIVCGGIVVVALLMTMWFALAGIILLGCVILLAWHMLGFSLYIKNSKTGETYTIKRFKRIN